MGLGSPAVPFSPKTPRKPDMPYPSGPVTEKNGKFYIEHNTFLNMAILIIQLLNEEVLHANHRNVRHNNMDSFHISKFVSHYIAKKSQKYPLEHKKIPPIFKKKHIALK